MDKKYEKWAYKIHQKEFYEDITNEELLQRAREQAESLQLDPDKMEDAMWQLFMEEQNAEMELMQTHMESRISSKSWEAVENEDRYIF